MRRGTYTGDTLNGVPHGNGTFVYFENFAMSNYTGGWRFGRKNGFGIMHWRSGDRLDILTVVALIFFIKYQFQSL